jgi:fatty-acyl-CoA synthase
VDLLRSLAHHTVRTPHAPLLIGPSGTIDYARAAEICAVIRSELVAAHEPGSRIGIASYRGFTSPLVYLAAQSARMQPVMIPWGLRSAVHELVTEHDLVRIYADPDVPLPNVPSFVSVAEVPGQVAPGLGATWPTPARGPGELASIQFSTGTTGRPKPMVRTVSVDYFDAVNYALAIGLGASERWLTPSPRNINVAIGALRRMILMGGAIVMMDDWSIADLDVAIADGITLVPQMTPGWQQIVDAGRLETLVSKGMRTALATGQRTSETLLSTIRRALPPDGQLVNYYGTTEASTLTVNSSRRVGFDRSGSVGIPAPLVEIELRPHHDLAGSSGVGEVWARSLATSPGYAGPDSRWQQDRFYDPGLLEPWFATGDAGSWTDAGELVLYGRLGDVIPTESGPVFPLRREAALAEVDGVREVAVVGAGEGAVEVLVVGDALCAELEPHLAGIPQVRVHRVAALPRNASDKLNRVEAARLVADRTPEWSRAAP